MALLELTGVTATYGPIEALQGIDLEVEAGEIVTLLGANGAGKTTTLRAITGMVSGEGRITFKGANITGLATERIARRGIGHVPEGRGTLVRLSVADNLRMGAYARSDGASVRNDIEVMYETFPILRQRASSAAGTLSGGEQQMLAIARALMSRPQLLLLDEPSLGLAPLVVRDIFEVVGRISRDDGVAVLLVEQNANMALKIAHRAYLMETGVMVAQGDARTMAADDSIRRSYLGY